MVIAVSIGLRDRSVILVTTSSVKTTTIAVNMERQMTIFASSRSETIERGGKNVMYQNVLRTAVHTQRPFMFIQPYEVQRLDVRLAEALPGDPEPVENRPQQ